MNETTDATALFAPLWKRKWWILGVAVLVAAGSYLYYKHQPSVYSAVTQVYLGNGAEEQSQIGASAGSTKKASAPNPATQAALINSSIIKEAVHDRLRRQRKTKATHAAVKGKAKATASEKSEFIAITAEARSARSAALLANTTAQTYIARENARYRAHVEAAIALARRQVRRVEAGALDAVIATGAPNAKTSTKSSSSGTATLQLATLDAKINQLESDLAVSQVTQVDPAKPKESKLVSPHPRSNALFGFAIGLVLAAFAAYGLGRLDRRLRSLAAVEEIFQAQILAALRAVRHPLVSRNGRPAPAYALREALWRLQTTLRVGSSAAEDGGEPANGHGGGPRSILCVSADAGDGKSTLIAALALAWAETGERVAVVEADFRSPVQSRLLQLSGSRGLADVLTGMLRVEEALQPVSLVRPEAGADAPAPDIGGSAATVVESAGSVSVLVGGMKVANPPALLGRPATAELVSSLSEDFDHVLIDAPSPLQVSDAMALLAAVDAIVIVARVGHTREASARRLLELLQRTPSAPVVGVVATAVSAAEIRRYGIDANTGSHRRGRRNNLIGR
ncbi:MAG TPA: Wzz/FepE/Etk N-terminal domain-containing protein [Solirubrobacteraceae bacterium]|nr:Wzz/FepE/Etk N-terminal domain-containing protein [Solirubrobacteraceae bacterium]